MSKLNPLEAARLFLTARGRGGENAAEDQVALAQLLGEFAKAGHDIALSRPLIAAAPDLLAALESVVATFHDHPDRDEISLAAARAAIAKAKGE